MKIAFALTALAFLAPTVVTSGGNLPGRQPYQWHNAAIVGGGFVSGILFHPKERGLAYARTDIGGAYRWDPKAHSWIPLVDWIQRPDWNLYGIESIGLDPSDPRRLYLAAGTYMGSFAGNGAILRSTDQGRSFRRTNMPFRMGGNQDGRSIGERLAVDPNKGSLLYFGSRDSGLWKSADFGATWSKQLDFPITGSSDGIGVCWEVFDPSTGGKGKPSSTIYVGVSSPGSNLYRSVDGGTTWSAVAGQPTGLTPHHAAINPRGELIVTYANGPGPNGLSAGAVWKLDTKSGDWTDITPNAGKGFGYAGLSIDLQRPGTLVVTSLDRWAQGDDVFRSTDDGQHWTGLKDTAKLDASESPFLYWGDAAPKFGWWMGTVQIDPFDSGHVLYGTGATIWESEDATNVDQNLATHWRVGARGLEETADIDIISPPTGAHLFSALGDIGGFRHDDLKNAPREGMQKNPLFTDTDSTDFAERNPTIMARVGRAAKGVKRGAYSLDGGLSWHPFPTEPNGSRGSGQIAVSADGKTMLWASEGADPSLTRDNGATWAPAAGLPRGAGVAADRVNPSRFYGFDARSKTFYKSADGGATFVAAAKDLPGGDHQVRAAPGQEGDVWLVAGGRLYHSIDAGVELKPIAGLTDVGSIGFGKPAPGQAYPATYLIASVDGMPGAFRSDDGAKTWVCITDAQHGFGTMDHIIGDPRIYGRVYIGTNGRGVLYGDPAVR